MAKRAMTPRSILAPLLVALLVAGVGSVHPVAAQGRGGGMARGGGRTRLLARQSGRPSRGHSVLAISAVSWPTGASAWPVLVHCHHATLSMRSTGSSPSQIESG